MRLGEVVGVQSVERGSDLVLDVLRNLVLAGELRVDHGHAPVLREVVSGSRVLPARSMIPYRGSTPFSLLFQLIIYRNRQLQNCSKGSPQ